MSIVKIEIFMHKNHKINNFANKLYRILYNNG